jgi:two-component system, OmpR family, osmolarity sensor histidine kinase EnvZ
MQPLRLIKLIYARLARRLAASLPTGLFARSLIIIIAPVILLQGIVVAVFLERHWAQATDTLSASIVAGVVSVVETYDRADNKLDARRILIAQSDALLFQNVAFSADASLPPAPVPARFDLVHSTLQNLLETRLGYPFALDTVSAEESIKLKVLVDGETLSIIISRARASVGNWHIFLVWMLISSLILIGIAVLFLRNQIRPILTLANAAEDFGKGREAEYKPRGAREVRRAGLAFMEMKRRIARSVDQRTTMLNGVSHDLRTVLTRFKLSLAFVEQMPETADLKRDVDEMNQMLDAYLAFAKGDIGERAERVDLGPILAALKSDAERAGHQTEVVITGDPIAIVRPAAFKRLLSNLVSNAARYGDRIEIDAEHKARWLTVTVDDDGPGIAPDKRETAFRPFMRLDEARTTEEGRSGLGLAIARDIARSHGGEITLGDSPLGGLRATVRVPG